MAGQGPVRPAMAWLIVWRWALVFFDFRRQRRGQFVDWKANVCSPRCLARASGDSCTGVLRFFFLGMSRWSSCFLFSAWRSWWSRDRHASDCRGCVRPRAAACGEGCRVCFRSCFTATVLALFAVFAVFFFMEEGRVDERFWYFTTSHVEQNLVLVVVSSRGHSACSFRCVIAGLLSGVVVVRCCLKVHVTSLHDGATSSNIFLR